MKHINHLIIEGRLTKDAVMEPNDKVKVCNFTIANNNSWMTENGKKEDVSFFDCSIFDKQAEALYQYLLKGTSVIIEGRLKQNRWTDKEGKNRSRLTIAVGNIQLRGKASESETTPEETSAASKSEEYGDYCNQVFGTETGDIY